MNNRHPESFESKNGKELFNPRHTVVVTTTWYPGWSNHRIENIVSPDQLRGNLAIETIKLAIQNNFQIVIVDGGSSEEFLDAVQTMGVTSIPQIEKGMSASRRQEFGEAIKKQGCEIVAWIEPEKISMIPHLAEAAALIHEGKEDIVVPHRTEKSFSTYPEQQVKLESQLNKWYNVILKKLQLLSEDADFDVAFGPRLFRNSPDVVKLFMTRYTLKKGSALEGIVRPDAYSNASFFPIMTALAFGYRVVSVPVDYHHPATQTQFETNNPEFEQKRITQRRDILRGAIQLARLLAKNSEKQSELVFVGDSL